MHVYIIVKGSLEVKLPTIRTDGTAEVGRVREEKSRNEQKREDQRRERVRRKKMQVREKVGKSRNTVFPMICGSGGSKSRLAKAAGAEPCGQMRDEKLHAVVARSTFPSQNVQNTPTSDHFWKLRCWKSARRCGAKHISKSKCTKHSMLGTLLEVEMSKKCAPLWRKAHFEVKSVKNWRVGSTFGRSDVVLCGRRKGLRTLSKVSKTWRFCSISKNHGKRGRWQAQYFVKPGINFSIIFRGRRSTLDRWSGKIAKCIGTRPSALHWTSNFWRKSRRIASFLMLSTSKIEEVSQNSFVFNVVKFKSWGSLAELLRFQACR